MRLPYTYRAVLDQAVKIMPNDLHRTRPQGGKILRDSLRSTRPRLREHSAGALHTTIPASLELDCETL